MGKKKDAGRERDAAVKKWITSATGKKKIEKAMERATVRSNEFRKACFVKDEMLHEPITL